MALRRWAATLAFGNGQAPPGGVLSYAARLLSTLMLIAAGFGVFSVKIGIAALLIASGAALASQPAIRRLIGRIVTST